MLRLAQLIIDTSTFLAVIREAHGQFAADERGATNSRECVAFMLVFKNSGDRLNAATGNLRHLWGISPMSRKSRQLRKAVARFEALERRDLLAGNVSVGVQNGQLLVLGDTAANGLTVVQLADFPGQPGTPGLLGNYLITPDATTQINQLAVGKSLFVTGATSGITASLSGGADNFQVTGRASSSIPSITVNSGAGDDILTFLSCSVTQNLHLTSPAGSDTVRISSSNLPGEVDVDGAGNLDFSLQQSQASSVFIKMDGIDLAAAKAYIKVTMQDCVVSSMVSVDTDSSLDLSAADSSLDRLYIKSVSSDTEYLKIKLEDVLISGYSEVDAQGSGHLDFVATGGALEAAYIKFDGIDGQAAPSTQVDLDGVAVSSLLELDLQGSVAMRAQGQHIKKAVLFVRKSGSDQHDYVVEVDEMIDSLLSLSDDGSLFDFEMSGGRADSVIMRRSLATAGLVQSNAIKLSDVVISSSVDVEVDGGADVSVARSKIDSFSIKQSALAGSPPAAIKIEIDGVIVSSVVDVSTDGDLEFTAGDSSVGEMALRSASGKHFTKVDLTASRATSIEVDSDSDSVDFSMTGGQVDRLYMKGKSKDNLATCAITIEEVLVSSFISVDFQGGVDFSQTGGQVGQLSVRSSGGSAGKVSLQDLHFSSVLVQCDSSLDLAMVDSSGDSVDVEVASVDGASLNFTKIKFDYARLAGGMTIDVEGGLDLSAVSSECTALAVTNTQSKGSGQGAGKVSLQDFHFSSVDVQCDSSLDLAMVGSEGSSVKVTVTPVDAVSLNFTKIKFDNARVSSSLVVDVGGDLELSCVGSQFAEGSVQDVRKQGTEQLDYYTVQFEDLLVSSFSVLSDASTRSLSASGGTLDALSVESSDATRSHHYTIKLTQASVSRAVSVDVEDASSLDVSFDGSACPLFEVSSSHASSAAGTGGGAGKVSMQDLHFTSARVQDDGGMLQVSATGGQFDRMSIKGDGGGSSYTIKLIDILVSSLVDVDVDDSSLLDFSAVGSQCDLLSVSSSHSGGGGGGAGKVSIQDFHFSSASVRDDGSSFAVTATGGSSDALSIKGESTARSHIIKLTDVLITGLVEVDVETADAVTFSAVDSQCAMLSLSSSRAPVAGASSGGGAGKVVFQDMHFSSVEVHDDGSLMQVHASGGVSSSASFQGDKRSDGVSRFYKVSFEDLTLAGAVAVDADASLDFSMDTCVTQGLHIATTDSARTGKVFQKVELYRVVSSGAVDVQAAGGLDLSADSCRSSSVFFKMDTTNSPQPSPPSHVSLTNGRVTGAMTLLGAAGDNDVTLDSMFISGPAVVALAGGNDRLAVLDSIFAKFALFAGGSGTDELTVQNSKFTVKPFQLDWETIST